MSAGDTVFLASRLIVVAFATFLAIILWSRTRDTAWMLVVIGTIASYADIVLTLLSQFGIVDIEKFSYGGIPYGKILFSNLQSIFYSIAFLIMIVRKRLK
jgi:hypothetical protein